MKEKIQAIIQQELKSHLLSVTHCGKATPQIQKTATVIIDEFVKELEKLKFAFIEDFDVNDSIDEIIENIKK